MKEAEILKRIRSEDFLDILGFRLPANVMRATY